MNTLDWHVKVHAFSVVAVTVMLPLAAFSSEEVVKPVEAPAPVRSRTTRPDNLLNFPKPAIDPTYREPPAPEQPWQRCLGAISQRLYDNWEPPHQPEKQKFFVHFSVDAHGLFSNIRLENPSQDKQANFAVLEAVYETSGFLTWVPPELTNDMRVVLDNSKKESTQDCSQLFAEKELENSDTVIWHLIPLEALKISPGLSYKTVHAKSNLRMIDSDDVKIERARETWNSFLHSGRSIAVKDVIKEAARIDKVLTSDKVGRQP